MSERVTNDFSSFNRIEDTVIKFETRTIRKFKNRNVAVTSCRYALARGYIQGIATMSGRARGRGAARGRPPQDVQAQQQQPIRRPGNAPAATPAPQVEFEIYTMSYWMYVIYVIINSINRQVANHLSQQVGLDELRQEGVLVASQDQAWLICPPRRWHRCQSVPPMEPAKDQEGG